MSIKADTSFRDEVLVERIQHNDGAALDILVLRYLPVIRKKAVAVRLKSMDADDLVQEAYIGLLDAVRSYDSKRGCKFVTYANTCIDNRIKKAIAAAVTVKNSALDKALNLDDVHETEDTSIKGEDPENIYIEKEMRRYLQAQIKLLLSSFERDVLFLYLDGLSYGGIADKLSVTGKSVDNALQRIRRKLSCKTAR